MENLKQTQFDAKHFYNFNGKGCPRGAKNDPTLTKDLDNGGSGLPDYSPQMQPVDFDTWVWSITNSRDYLPPGLTSNPDAKKNFNKIWDGQNYRYVVNSDGMLCSVVSKDNIIEKQREKHKYKTQGEYLDQLEGSLGILLNNLGVSIDNSLSHHQNSQRLKKLNFNNSDDSDIALIRNMEHSDDIIKPGAHGCSPRQFFNPSEARDRSRYAGLKTPQKLNINMRVSASETEADKYGGRLPLNYNNSNAKDVACVVPNDPRLMRDDHRAAYHHLRELDRIPLSARERGESMTTDVHNASMPASSGELYSAAAVCAQQVNNDQCNDPLQLKVTPFGNEDNRTPNDLCKMHRHPVTNEKVCTPRLVADAESDRLREWYFGSRDGDGGFFEKEQRLMEANHSMHNPTRRSPLISDELITAEDIEDCQAIERLSGIRRFAERHEAQKINSNY